jgi:protease I
MAIKQGRILIFVHDLYDEMELHYPRYRLIEAGYQTVIAGPEKGKPYKSKHGMECIAEAAFTDVKEEDFKALIIPGGYAPDKLRRDSRVLDLTRQFHDRHKPIAYICHGGWVPISAKIMQGFQCTSAPAIKDDLINAGAQWLDQAVVVDRHLISSRGPQDLPVFCPAIIQALT